jgi:lysophospholipase L1-like esterase
MKIALSIISLLGFFFSNSQNLTQNLSLEQKMNEKKLTYLALGDSYTIGEGLEETDRYPNQLVRKLRKSTSLDWQDPKIIAKTGWTVDELNEGINQANLGDQKFDLVTLSIGVNNQYRGRPVEDYKLEFEAMLKRAIAFAGNKSENVIVLSIPDWGVTPFAVSKGVDQKKIASEIDAYNQAKQEICEVYDIQFIDITEDYRKIGGKIKMVVNDNLHPSSVVHRQWTDKLVSHILSLKF